MTAPTIPSTTISSLQLQPPLVQQFPHRQSGKCQPAKDPQVPLFPLPPFLPSQHVPVYCSSSRKHLRARKSGSSRFGRPPQVSPFPLPPFPPRQYVPVCCTFPNLTSPIKKKRKGRLFLDGSHKSLPSVSLVSYLVNTR